jgi:hypothetical protein
MSKITLAPNASGSGTLTVAAPNTNTDRTITLPDLTGTAVVNQGSGAFVINSSGNVGVGTSSPSAKLDVVDGYLNVRLTDASLSRINLNNTNRAWSISNYGTSTSPNGAFAVADETASAARLIIDSSGNVGIGMMDVFIYK